MASYHSHGLPAYPEADTADTRAGLAVLRRRATLGMAVFVAALLAALLVSALWPATYRASAVILIEQQEIPPEIVRSTVTAFADERLQIITQRIMTTPTLLELMRKFDLYELERLREPQERLLDRIRNDIGLRVISADVNDPRSGRPVQATIAFELSYRYRSAAVAHQVANELVTLYQQENRRVRTDAVDSTAAFLADEADKLRRRIETLEGRLAAFKADNVTDLPELFAVNVELLHRTERDMVELRRQLRVVQDRQALVNATLAQMVEANGNGDAGARLAMLRQELAAAAARYGPSHPDVQRLRREVDALDGTLTQGAGDRASELAGLRLERIELLSRYSPRHPDVVSVEQRIAELERRLADDPAAADRGRDPVSAATRGAAARDGALLERAAQLAPQSPAIGSLLAQLESARAEEAGLRQQIDELAARLAQYEARLQQSPLVESEYRALARDYDNELLKYREIKNKLLTARLAQSLETNQQAERFTVLEYPTPPQAPESPNRPAIIFVGIVLALGAALGVMTLAESLDRSVRGPAAVAEALGLAPMVLVPVIRTPSQQARRRRLAYVGGAALAALLVLGVVLVHQWVIPLDTALLLLIQRVGL